MGTQNGVATLKDFGFEKEYTQLLEYTLGVYPTCLACRFTLGEPQFPALWNGGDDTKGHSVAFSNSLCEETRSKQGLLSPPPPWSGGR